MIFSCQRDCQFDFKDIIRKNKKDILLNYIQKKPELLNAAIDENGWTPLHYAASLNKIEIGRLLLDKGANYRARSLMGYTPQDIALRYGHTDFVKLLLSYGDTENIFTYCAIGNLKKLSFLIESDKKNLDNEMYGGFRPIHIATVHSQKEAIKLLLNTGDNINKMGPGKLTPLHLAILMKDYKIILFLLKNGANPLSKTWEGFNAIQLAQIKKMRKIVNLLENYMKNEPLKSKSLGEYKNIHSNSNIFTTLEQESESKEKE